MGFNPFDNAILMAVGCAFIYVILTVGICLLI